MTESQKHSTSPGLPNEEFYPTPVETLRETQYAHMKQGQ